MSYPAYEAFGRAINAEKDIRVGFARWRVYMALQPPFVAHDIPVVVKVDSVRLLAHLGKHEVIAALNWLETAGYIRVHSRDGRGTRLVTLAYRVPD